MALTTNSKVYLISNADYMHNIEKAFFKDGQEIFLSGKLPGNSLKIDAVYYSNMLNKSLDEFKKTNLYNLNILLDIKNNNIFDHMDITIPDVNKLVVSDIRPDYVIEYVDNCYDNILKLLSSAKSELGKPDFTVPDVTTEVLSVIKNTLRSSGVFSSYSAEETINAGFDEVPLSGAYFIQYVRPFLNNIKQNRDTEIMKIAKVVEAVDYAESFIDKIYKRVYNTVTSSTFTRVEYANLIKYIYVHIKGLLTIMSKITFVSIHELCRFDSFFSKVNQLSVYVANTMGTTVSESVDASTVYDALIEYDSNPFTSDVNKLIDMYGIKSVGYTGLDTRDIDNLYPGEMVYPFMRLRDILRAFNVSDIDVHTYSVEEINNVLRDDILTSINDGLYDRHKSIFEESSDPYDLAAYTLEKFIGTVEKASDAIHEIHILMTNLVSKFSTDEFANTVFGDEVINTLNNYRDNIILPAVRKISEVFIKVFMDLSETIARDKEYTEESTINYDGNDYLNMALDYEYECVKFDNAQEFRMLENEFFIAKENMLHGHNVIFTEADGNGNNNGQNNNGNGNNQNQNNNGGGNNQNQNNNQSNSNNSNNNNQNNNQKNDKASASIDTDNNPDNKNNSNDKKDGKNIFQRAIEFIRNIVQKFIDFITSKAGGNKKFFERVKPDVLNMTDAQKKGLSINTLPYDQYPYTNIKANIEKTKTAVQGLAQGVVLKDKKAMFKRLFPYFANGANKIEDDEALAKYFTNFNKIGPKAGAGDPQYVSLNGMNAYNFLSSEVIPYCEAYINGNYPTEISNALKELTNIIEDKGVKISNKDVDASMLCSMINKFSGACLNAIRDRFQDHITLLKNISNQIKNNSSQGDNKTDNNSDNNTNNNQNNNNENNNDKNTNK